MHMGEGDTHTGGGDMHTGGGGHTHEGRRTHVHGRRGTHTLEGGGTYAHRGGWRGTHTLEGGEYTHTGEGTCTWGEGGHTRGGEHTHMGTHLDAALACQLDGRVVVAAAQQVLHHHAVHALPLPHAGCRGLVAAVLFEVLDPALAQLGALVLGLDGLHRLSHTQQRPGQDRDALQPCAKGGQAAPTHNTHTEKSGDRGTGKTMLYRVRQAAVPGPRAADGGSEKPTIWICSFSVKFRLYIDVS